jgi:hypothetical protein
MGTVSTTLDVPYATSEVEALWYDTTRWPNFIDGFDHIDKRDPAWPKSGSELAWDSRPDGRGRVLETVQSYEPRMTCVSSVEDEKLRGTQTITFTPRQGGTTVKLALDYKLKQRTFFSPVVDMLFIRRAQTQSLQRTLYRFSLELRSDHAPV